MTHTVHEINMIHEKCTNTNANTVIVHNGPFSDDLNLDICYQGHCPE